MCARVYVHGCAHVGACICMRVFACVYLHACAGARACALTSAVQAAWDSDRKERHACLVAFCGGESGADVPGLSSFLALLYPFLTAFAASAHRVRTDIIALIRTHKLMPMGPLYVEALRSSVDANEPELASMDKWGRGCEGGQGGDRGRD